MDHPGDVEAEGKNHDLSHNYSHDHSRNHSRSVNRSLHANNNMAACRVNQSRSYMVPPSQQPPSGETLEMIGEQDTSRQLWFFTALVLPNAISYVVDNLLEFINLVMLGKKNDPLMLGACGLGNCWIFVVVIALPCGLGTAIDAFCSQAFAAKDFRSLGTVFNRGIIIINLAVMPLLLISWEARRLLALVGYDADLAQAVGDYVRYQFPSMILEIQTLLIMRFLNAHGVNNFQFYVSLTTTLFHAFICYEFVIELNYGIKGASLALNCTSLLHFFLCYGYARISSRFALSWRPFDLDTFRQWGDFFRLALPNALMFIPEYFGLFVLGFEAGYLPSVVSLASHAMMCNILNFVYGIAYGYGVAAGGLVNAALGSDRADLARRLPEAAFKCFYLTLAGVALLLLLLRPLIVRVFTTESQVYDLAYQLFPLVVATQVTDGLQAVFGGILRGIDRTRLAALGNLVSYLFVLHPVALILAFVMKLDVFGLWIGWLVGTGFSGLFYMDVWSKLDLEAAARAIQEANQNLALDEAGDTSRPMIES